MSRLKLEKEKKKDGGVISRIPCSDERSGSTGREYHGNTATQSGSFWEITARKWENLDANGRIEVFPDLI